MWKRVYLWLSARDSYQSPYAGAMVKIFFARIVALLFQVPEDWPIIWRRFIPKQKRYKDTQFKFDSLSWCDLSNICKPLCVYFYFSSESQFSTKEKSTRTEGLTWLRFRIPEQDYDTLPWYLKIKHLQKRCQECQNSFLFKYIWGNTSKFAMDLNRFRTTYARKPLLNKDFCGLTL